MNIALVVLSATLIMTVIILTTVYIGLKIGEKEAKKKNKPSE